MRTAELTKKSGEDDIHLLFQDVMEVDRGRVCKRKHAFGPPDDRAAIFVEIRLVAVDDTMIETQSFCQHLAELNIARFGKAESKSRQRPVMFANCRSHGATVVAAAEKNTDA